MSEPTITPTLVVLPGHVWRSELTAELERLGIDAERAPISAGNVLGAICARSGYRAQFLIGQEETDLPIPKEPGKRSYAASRRRESRIVDRAAPE